MPGPNEVRASLYLPGGGDGVASGTFVLIEAGAGRHNCRKLISFLGEYRAGTAELCSYALEHIIP